MEFSTDVVTIADEFDDFAEQVADLQSEISGLSALFKDNLDSSVASYINTSKNAFVRDQFPYPFCDRSFSSKIGLRQHKKSRHLDEYLLEIEHRYLNRRNHPWEEEELRILFPFEQYLLREGVKFINIKLAKLLPHRSHPQITEIRKSRHYKLLKENFIFEFSNFGLSPPSPAVLLSPATAPISSSLIKDQKRLFIYLDSPTPSDILCLFR